MIKLDDNWRVEEDAASWNLKYEAKGEINPETGKPVTYRDISFHANLKQALVEYLHRNTSGCEDVEEAVRAMSAAEDRIYKALEGK